MCKEIFSTLTERATIYPSLLKKKILHEKRRPHNKVEAGEVGWETSKGPFKGGKKDHLGRKQQKDSDYLA